MNSIRDPARARLRLRVTSAAESALRAGHPWLYSESIREQNHAGKLGELAVIYDRRDRFLAIGLFDPASPLRVRLLHHGKPVTIDRAWWRDRFHSTVARRGGWFDQETTGYRCIHGESDGWPGLVLDRYDSTSVLKLYSGVWLPMIDDIVGLVGEGLPANCLVLRLSRNIQALAKQDFSKQDGQVLFGPMPEQPVIFLENGLRFESDVLRGQKTGFFLDQRENRQRVGSLAAGRSVLNAFCFTGGFSVYAARGGARAITDVDMSAHALEVIPRNFALNDRLPRIGACPRVAVQADAFAWLSRVPDRHFDLVILDPPSLAKRESERAGAVRAYQRLVQDAVRWLSPGGILVAASCSAHVTAAEFFAAVRAGARHASRNWTTLAETRHPVDHPSTFPEADYLKCIYLRDDSRGMG